jgi:hypothetical protein
MKYLIHFTKIILFLSFLTTGTAQELKWIYKIGGLTAEYGNGLTMDSGQNIYDITNFMGKVEIPNSLSFTSRGAEDVLVRKSSGLGILQWVRQIGGPGQIISFDIAADNADNIYIVGTFKDSIFLDNDLIMIGNTDRLSSFIIKLNKDGVFVWARNFESTIAVSAKSVTAGFDNELVISGSFEGNAVFGSGFPAISHGGNDAFILKMNGTIGVPIILKTFGGLDHDYIYEHTRDNQNNIIITGEFRDVVDFDPGVNEYFSTSQGVTDIFILKLSSDGSFRWAKTFGSEGIDGGYSVATDASRNVIFTGKFSDNINFGNSSNTIYSSGGTDIFVAKADENGNIIWVNRYGDLQNDKGSKVIVNSTGVIYLAGEFRGKVDFNPDFVLNNSSESKGGADIFIALYNQDGSYNLHFSIGGIANEQISDLVLKNNGELISTGGFGATVDFDPSSGVINIFSTGGLDAFLLNTFICVNPYLKKLTALKPEICFGERAFIQISESHLNGATQWSWQRDSCSNITFASGDFLNVFVSKNTSFFVKGFGGCVVNDLCRKVDIKVFKDSIRYQNLKLCLGDTIKIGNNKYISAGVYVDSLVSKSGCDSVIISEIAVFPKYHSTQAFQICNGDSIIVGSSVYTSPGRYTDVLKTVNGCDSVIVTTLDVLPSSIDFAEAKICKGQTVTINNVTYNATGTYIQSTFGDNGCENFLIIKVFVLETEFYKRVLLCEGDSIVVGNSIYKTNGIFTDHLTSSFGCDSIITSDIQILKKSSLYQDISLCAGDSIKVGNKYYKSTGNYLDTLKNKVGCDSIVSTDIRVYPKPAVVTQKFNICEGQSISVGNKSYRIDGTYRDTLISLNGCDSIVVTSISVTKKFHVVIGKICFGDSATIAGQTFTASGSYTINLINSLGCDSIIVFNLGVIPENSTTVNYFICPGNTVTIGNSTYNSPGVYHDKFVARSGCDSLVTSILYWNHVTTQLQYKLCSGESVMVHGKRYDKTGVFGDTIRKSDGCDSILIINVRVNPTFFRDTLFEICKGASISVGTGTYTSAGKYFVKLITVNGCDSVINFEVRIINFIPVFSAVRDTLKAFKIDGAKYQWYECINQEKIALLGAVGSELPLYKSGRFALEITYKGCTAISNCFEFIRSTSQETKMDIVKIYPNPVIDYLNVEAPEEMFIAIKDISNRSVRNVKLVKGLNQILLSDLNSGMYLLAEVSGSYVRIFKFIKQ